MNSNGHHIEGENGWVWIFRDPDQTAPTLVGTATGAQQETTVKLTYDQFEALLGSLEAMRLTRCTQCNAPQLRPPYCSRCERNDPCNPSTT